MSPTTLIYLSYSLKEASALFIDWLFIEMLRLLHGLLSLRLYISTHTHTHKYGVVGCIKF